VLLAVLGCVQVHAVAVAAVCCAAQARPSMHTGIANSAAEFAHSRQAMSCITPPELSQSHILLSLFLLQIITEYLATAAVLQARGQAWERLRPQPPALDHAHPSSLLTFNANQHCELSLPLLCCAALQACGQARRLWPQPPSPPLTLAARQGRWPQPARPRCCWPQEPQPCQAQEPRPCKGELECVSTCSAD
jgi:hypothetical protein